MKYAIILLAGTAALVCALPSSSSSADSTTTTAPEIEIVIKKPFMKGQPFDCYANDYLSEVCLGTNDWCDRWAETAGYKTAALCKEARETEPEAPELSEEDRQERSDDKKRLGDKMSHYCPLTFTNYSVVDTCNKILSGCVRNEEVYGSFVKIGLRALYIRDCVRKAFPVNDGRSFYTIAHEPAEFTKE